MASFLILISAITVFLLYLSPANAAPIFDINGQPIRTDSEVHYQIIPYGSGYGIGPLTTAPVDSNSPCPRYITESDNFAYGTPVTISNPDSKRKFLSIRLPIEISFYEHWPVCDKPLRWWVAPKDSNGDSYVIVGTDGPFKSSYFFKMESDKKVQYAYTIKFCHVLEFSSDFGMLAVVDEECNDVGFLNNGRLGITPNKPFPFQFMVFAPRFGT